MGADSVAGSRTRLILLLLALLAFGLRIYRLDQQSLWYDEGFSVYVARQDLSQIASSVAGDYSPPLHYYLLHFWMGAAGDSEFAVRFLSVVAGCLLIPLTYGAARRLTRRQSALWATALVTVSPFLIWYSQEARAYSLLAALGLLTSYLILRLTIRPEQPRLWLLYAMSGSLAIYSHLYAFLLLAIQAAFFFAGMIFRRRLRAILAGAVAFSIIGVAYLPWAENTLRAAQDTSGYFPGVLRSTYVLRATATSFSTGDLLPPDVGDPVTALYGALALAGAGLLLLDELRRRSESAEFPPGARLYLIAQLAIPVAWVILVLYQRPKFFPRHLIASAPFFLMLSGVALDALWRARWRAPARILGVALAGALLAASAGALLNNYTDARYARDDFRSAVAYLQERIGPGEEILLSSGHFFPAFTYYYRGDNWHPIPDDFLLNVEHVIGFEVSPELDRILAGKAGVWLVQWQDHIVDPMGTLRLLLETHGELIDARWQPRGPVLYRYGLPNQLRISAEPPIAVPMSINFGDRLRFLGYSPPKYREARVIEVILFWQGLRALSEDYKVSLRLVDAAGNLYTLNDGWPASVGYPTPRWPVHRVVFGRQRIIPPTGAPPGEYWVDIVVYEGATLAPVEVRGLGTSIRIGPFSLAPTERPATLQDLAGQIQTPLQVAFGSEVELVGYNWEPRPVRPGETVHFTLFWRALRDMDQDYLALFPLVHDQETLLAGSGDPLSGPGYPTSAWREGELLRVHYSYRVPPQAPVGQSQLRIMLVGPEGQVGATAVLFPIAIQRLES